VLDDYVCVDNRFRFIDAFVDCLDLVEAGFARVQSMATAGPVICWSSTSTATSIASRRRTRPSLETRLRRASG
jgi:hypothetical protein